MSSFPVAVFLNQTAIKGNDIVSRIHQMGSLKVLRPPAIGRPVVITILTPAALAS